ncbi:hypothetical protein [Streptomyces sp. NPDC018045]|uniref:hypothetical protein n=1 Tax=Streptomyces sp. NPDC018045 TaxID=3365037 RepID=UPI0037BB8027
MMKALRTRPRHRPRRRTARAAGPLIETIGGADSGATVAWAGPALAPARDDQVRWRCELLETPTASHAARTQRDAGHGPAPSAAVAVRWLITSLLTCSPSLPAQRAEALVDWATDPLIRDVLMRALDRYGLSVSVRVADDHGALTWRVEPVAGPHRTWLHTNEPAVA